MSKALLEIVGRDSRLYIDPGETLREVANRLGIKTVEYIPTVNGEVVTWDYKVSEEDKVKLIPVISGGGGCIICGETPVYSYVGRVYCKKHFIEYIERKVLNTIYKYGLIDEGDHIAVAVSGGKDSLTLLNILNKYKGELSIELSALIIDEGISGYRDLTIQDFIDINRRLGVRYRVISYKDVFGLPLDEILRLAGRIGAPVYPCSYCGVFRRYLINIGARIMGADKLATGHNLDDMIQTFILNIVTNSLERILHLEPKTMSADHPLLIPRIKPLYETLEMETALYALLNGLYPRFIECVYAPEALRNDIRDLINHMEEENPGIKQVLLNSMLKIIEDYKGGETPKINSCGICGEPTSGEICRTCAYLDRLGILERLLDWRREVGLESDETIVSKKLHRQESS